MPPDLQTVLSTCTKYSHNVGLGGSSNDVSSKVTATTESVFTLSEFEIEGERKYANSAEQNKQAQYDYFANGNSKQFYIFGDEASGSSQRLRSINC